MPHVLAQILNVAIKVISGSDTLPHAVGRVCVPEAMAGRYFTGSAIKRGFFQDIFEYAANCVAVQVFVFPAWKEVFPIWKQFVHFRIIFNPSFG